MPLTIYEKELIRILRTRCGELTNRTDGRKAWSPCGVIDSTLCKVLAVREHVRDIMETGIRKTDAMWAATDGSPAPTSTCANACTTTPI